MNKPNVAILVPVCSRNQKYETINDIPLLKKLYKSFCSTTNDDYNYTFFIGYDDDDIFYKKHAEELKNIDSRFNIYEVSGCQHAPANVWNVLAERAYISKHDYYFQVGDDVLLTTNGWVNHFINKLSSHNNIGVVGPCNFVNYNQRAGAGRPYVIENSFVHRTHLDIFGYFFHPSIKNWFCDDWITEIYRHFYSEIQLEYPCENSIVDCRYQIKMVNDFPAMVEEGRHKIAEYTKISNYLI